MTGASSGRGVSRLPGQSTCRTGEYRGKRAASRVLDPCAPSPAAFSRPWNCSQPALHPGSRRPGERLPPASSARFPAAPAPARRRAAGDSVEQCRNTVEGFSDAVSFLNLLRNQALCAETGAGSNSRRDLRFSDGQDRRGTWLSDNGPPFDSATLHRVREGSQLLPEGYVRGQRRKSLRRCFDTVRRCRPVANQRRRIAWWTRRPKPPRPATCRTPWQTRPARAGARRIACWPSRPASYGGVTSVFPGLCWPC
jgi:hypothetical protein